ncbi:MAG: hypothetical protein KAV82_02625 [Phycisphaerae bacterium]|nr:hypothetical protein [Phycisphaerae bacterium]
MNAWCDDGIPAGCWFNGITAYQVPGYREGGWEDHICPPGGFFDTLLGLTHAHFHGSPLPTTSMNLDFEDGRTGGGPSCWDLGIGYGPFSIGYEACTDYSDICYVILEALDADAEGIWAISIVDIPYCQSGRRGTYIQGGRIQLTGLIEEGTLSGDVGALEVLGHIVISFTSTFAGSDEILDGAEIYACDDYTRQPRCPNGVCDDGENPCNCPQDCNAPGTCCTSEDCDDENICTTDSCPNYVCQHANNNLSCDDGLFCTKPDRCSGGYCVGGLDDPCSGGGECNDHCNEGPDNCYDSDTTSCTDDGNECTYDKCDGQGSCAHPWKPNDTPCAGGEGKCVNGVCEVESDPDINCEELTGHDFGRVFVDNWTAVQTWQIKNKGGGNLEAESYGVSLFGPDASQCEFTQGGGHDCFPLVHDQSCTVGVRCYAETTGPKHATLRIETNDEDESPCDVGLTWEVDGFGDCSDEDVTITSDTELARDMNYRNLTVSSNVTLDTHGYTVKVCETLTNHGEITDNWSGGDGGDGGTDGKGSNYYQHEPPDVPAECLPREIGCTGGDQGDPSDPGVVPEAGHGGHGGGGGGGGGGGWHGLQQADADGGNGGAGGAGGKGGGYVKVLAYRLDNRNVIHAGGLDGEDGEDAPRGQEGGNYPPGYEECGAEYFEWRYLLLLRDLAGGGGGGGAGGDGGDGGTVEVRYSELLHEGSIHADGGQGGQGGAGGSEGGACERHALTGGYSDGCPGGTPGGGPGGHGCYSGGSAASGTEGAVGGPGSGGSLGTTVIEQLFDCLSDPDCDDGLYCNGAEHCVNKECEAGTPPDCSDGLDCTGDWCYEGANECRHDLELGYCLIGSVCYLGGAINPANDCQDCNPALSTLAWSPRLAGVLCGNHDITLCTNPDTCDSTGVCQPNNSPDNTPCDDSLFCNGNEVCLFGECQPGEPPVCDDGIPCTEDFCDEFGDTCASVPNDDLCPGAGLFCGEEICEPANPTADSNGCAQLRPPCMLGEVCDEDTDSCLPDCNLNGVPDAEDISQGTSQDCNSNGTPDECDIARGNSEDCQPNLIPDECDIVSGTSADCNSNTVPDECEYDCNQNGFPDDCDISAGTSADCNTNGIPDECDPDCNTNGIPDDCELLGDEVHLDEGFEGGLPAGWSAIGLWHITDQCPRSNDCDPTHWAYYGQDGPCNFDVGTNAGILTAPAINLPSAGVNSVTLSYCSAYNGEGPPYRDAAWVSVNGIEVDNVSVEGTQLTWETRTVDLTSYAGQTVVLAWHFDSQDEIFNGQLGWQVDRIQVVSEGTSSDCNNNSVPDECERGDSNGDGSVDLRDFAGFQICFGQTGTLDAACCLFDFEPDEDVDLDDYTEFSATFTGPQP